MDEDFEELEQIPWAALAKTPGDTRARLATIGILVGVAVLAGGWLMTRGGSATAALPPSSLEPEVAATPIVVPASTTEPPAVYSEADLMLISPDDEQLLAIMHAEWLVRDYLTIDGDPNIVTRLDKLIPNAERGTDPTYVEWVGAFAVVSPEPGRYAVDVVYSVLVDSGRGYERQPAGAMTATVAIDVDGTAALVGPLVEARVPQLASAPG